MSISDQLRHEIDETRRKFHQLLEQVPDEAFSWPSRNPAWTIGEVLYHMSLAPRFIGADVRMITGSSWLYRLIPRLVPKQLFDWGNARVTRFGARRLSRQFLAGEYDKGNRLALRALDSLAAGDFRKNVLYPGWDPLLAGEVSLERLFHYIKDHFESHAAEIESLISAAREARE